MNFKSKGQSATSIVIAVIVIGIAVAGVYLFVSGEDGGVTENNQQPTNQWIGSGRLDGEGIPPDFFSDVHIRKAFAYSFDFQTFIEDAFLGQAIKAPGPIPTDMKYFNDDQEMFSYDLEKAQEQFKKAYGGSVDDPGPVWEEGFKMTITYNSDATSRQIAAQMLKETIENINPKFDINTEGRKWSSQLNDLVSGKLPVFIIGWAPDFPDPHNFVVPFMHSTGTFSKFQGYDNAYVDNLIDQGVSTVAQDERRDIYYELQEIYHNQAISFPLCEPTARRYHRDSVQGWYHNPMYPGGIYAYPLSKSSASSNPNELIIQRIAEPETLDPAWAYDTASSEVIFNAYEPLLFFDGTKTDEYVPRIATEWEVLDDGTTYRFKIRDGVEFHNGNSLTPEDVEYTFERLMVMDRSGGPSWMLLEPLLGTHGTRKGGEIVVDFSEIDNSVEVDGDWIQFNLPEPYPPLLGILAQSWSSIIDKEWAADQGAWPGTEETWENYNDPAEAPLQDVMNGTGPFMFDRWEKGSQNVLSSFDNYWRETANFDAVKIQKVGEWSTRKSAFQQGDADIIGVPRSHSPELEGIEGITVHKDLASLQTDPALFFTFDIQTNWE